MNLGLTALFVIGLFFGAGFTVFTLLFFYATGSYNEKAEKFDEQYLKELLEKKPVE